MIGVEELYEEASEFLDSFKDYSAEGSTVYREWEEFVEINYR